MTFWSAYFLPFSGVFGHFLEVGGKIYHFDIDSYHFAMATIRVRKLADGTVRYTAQIRIKRDGAQVYQETQSFVRKQAAQAWIRRREAELYEPDAIEKANRVGVPLAEIIDRYLQEVEKARPLGKTKRATLKAISLTTLGQVIDSQINSQRLVEYALWRMSKAGGDVQPQTAANDMAHLGAVLSVAKPAWGYQVDQHAMADARKVLKKLGYHMKSQERSRRPTKDELQKLLQHFSAGQKIRPTSINMIKVLGFAMFSTRRQDEITRIRWADLDEEEHRILVRDMKNPGQKIGNNVWCHIPYPAWEILQSMPRKCAEIFPYNPDSISASWTRACKFLGIDDLHFHDLRHEGVSRLFEMEWDIPRVASVSGHRDWNSMRRYTHLRRRGDVWLEWEWIERMIKSPVELGSRVAVNVGPRRKHR